MKLSRDQEQAVAKLGAFLRSDDKIFRLQGAAGSGKSTVVAETVDPDEVTFVAPTAKAATVLNRKGVPAQTIHSLLYQPYEYEHPRTRKPTLGFKLNPRCRLSEGGVVLVDEASMVPSQIAEDLLSFPVKVIAVGDPFQLPPVMSRGGRSLLSGDPDALLTEVHRTALDSPVLELATSVRERGQLPRVFERGHSKIVNDLSEAGDLTSFDQIIVGLHRTRFSANSHLRKLRGYTDDLPEIGEEILAKKNDPELGIVNGESYPVRSLIPMDPEFSYVRLATPEGDEVDTTMWTYGFQGKAGMQTLEQMPFKDRNTNVEAWFSEAITCHSAQGSEHPRVLVVDESRTFGSAASRWLYTAVTRASESVTVVRR